MQLRSRDTLTIATGKSDKDFDLPFIPHFTVVGLTPHGNFDFGGGGDVEGCLSNHVSKYWNGKKREMRLEREEGKVQKVQVKRTFKGKKMGNQEIISLLLSSMVLGLMLSSIFLLPSAGE